jgi:signal transduction histidine kinase/Tfp pilus assembly protein PilF
MKLVAFKNIPFAILTIIFSIIGISCYSQTNNDSLLSIVNSSRNDTTKINTYIELGRLYTKTDNDKAIDYVLNALDIARQIDSKQKEALCHHHLGLIYESAGSDEKAFEHLEKSIDLYENLNEMNEAARVYSDLGFTYHRFDDYGKAKENYQKALSIFRELGNKKQIAYNLNRAGLAETELGDFDNALKSHLDALEIYEEIGEANNTAGVNNNIGNVYNRLGNNEKALYYYEAAIEQRERLGQMQGIIASLINIGAIYTNIYDFDNALKSFNKALEYVNKNTNTQWVVSLYINIGTTYYDMGNFGLAIKNLEIALKKAEDYNFKLSQSICRLNLGMIYFEIGKLGKAVEEIEIGLPIAEQSNVKPLLAEFYKTSSEIYAAISDYKKSYEYFNLYSELKDNVFNMESASQIAEMQTKHEAAKNEKAIKLLQSDNKIKDLTLMKKKTERNYYIFVFILILFLLLIIINRYRIKTKTNKLLVQKNNEIQRVNAELKNKNQIILEQNEVLGKYTTEQKALLATKDKFFSIIAHDLKNPFNAIIGLSNIVFHEFDQFDESGRIGLIKRINKSAKEVFKLLENLLDWSRSQSGRLDFAPEVLDIGQMAKEAVLINEPHANSKNIELSLKIDNNTFVFADKNMLLTVFRNLISNAVKFTDVGGKVELTAENVMGFIRINIKDNGIGISKENINKLFLIDKKFQTNATQNEKGTGLGLILCKEFVERNKGEIWVESEPGKGSVFTFTVPTDIN